MVNAARAAAIQALWLVSRRGHARDAGAGGTSRVTTARTSTRAPAPTVTPRRTPAAAPTTASSPITTGAVTTPLAYRALDVADVVVEVDDDRLGAEAGARADLDPRPAGDHAALGQPRARPDADDRPGPGAPGSRRR